MIIFKNVTKSFPLGNKGLDNVSLEIEDNDFIFLVGPSGAGKTSILKMITRQMTPSEGEVYINGSEISNPNFKDIAQLRKSIGIVFQDFKILYDKNIFENIALSLRVLEKNENEIEEEVDKVLNLVNLSNKKLLFPIQLSAGELQRVAIARAITGNRNIILADEPTGNLDPKTSWDIMEIFKKIEKDKTIIIATHNAEIVNSMKKRVITLKNNKIIKDEKKGGYHI